MKNPFKREDFYILAKAFGTLPASFALRSGIKFASYWRIGAAGVSILGLGLSAASAVLNRIYKTNNAPEPAPDPAVPHTGVDLSLVAAQSIWGDKTRDPAANVRANSPAELHPLLQKFSTSTVPILGVSRFLAGAGYFGAGITTKHYIEAGCGLAFLAVGWLMTKATPKRLLYATILGCPTGLALAAQGFTPKFDPLFIGCGVSLTASFLVAYASGMDKFNQGQKGTSQNQAIAEIIEAGSRLEKSPQRRKDLPPSPPALQ